jgi:Glycosyl transferases group 1/Hint domain
VEAHRLVNGASITQCAPDGPTRYVHIELDRHDIILAEGAPSESFVDCDTRALFDAPAAPHHADRPARWVFCAPRIEAGPILDQIRRAINRRAGVAPSGDDAAFGPLKGNVDGLIGDTLTGWAFDTAHPETAVALEVLDGDALVARVAANRFRPDLLAAGIGDGRHGFALPLPAALSPRAHHVLHVRRLVDGRALIGSPVTIPARERSAQPIDTGRAIEQVANAASDPASLDALLDVLLQGVDTLRRANAEPSNHQRPTRRAKRALVIDDVLPRRDRDAGSNAILSHIGALRSLGWTVECVASGDLAGDDAAAAALRAWDVVCHRAPVVASVEEVLRRNRNLFDLVYLHRLSNAEAYAPLARTWQSKARIVYCLADLHHVRAARQAEVHANDEQMETATRLKAREIAAMRQADVTITHSSAEAAYLAQEVPGTDVRVIPWSLTPRPCPVPFADRNGIAFIGGMRHAPNPDAVRWMAAEVLPRVWARLPDMLCLLAGADWPEAVWGRLDPRLRLLGPVPNLDDVFAQVRLTIAPLRFGAGVKGKVLDSFAAGLPCVMSPIAAEGIPLDAVLRSAVAGDAIQMADRIFDLHTRPALNARHAEAGLTLIRTVYTEAAVTAAIAAVAGSGAR